MGSENEISWKGEVVALDEEQVWSIIDELKEKKVEGVAVSLLHSYVNPIHENRIYEMIKAEWPTIYVSLSSRLLPEFREYERTSTVAIDAYVSSATGKHIENMEEDLSPLQDHGKKYIMQANGGLGTFEACKMKPINTVLSGPIGGVIGAAFISSLIECKNVISLDMGGTSCDVSLIKDHRAGATTSMMIGNVPIKIPIIDLNTVGAAGEALHGLTREAF